MGSAAFVAGIGVGAAGGTLPSCSSTPAPDAPPLPWEWCEIDPLEAGRRAYRQYFDPVRGGCATRVLVKMDGVDDIRKVYAGSHPILYCGDFGRHAATFAELYGLEIRTNA